jgi:hypothetical protein
MLTGCEKSRIELPICKCIDLDYRHFSLRGANVRATRTSAISAPNVCRAISLETRSLTRCDPGVLSPGWPELELVNPSAR